MGSGSSLLQVPDKFDEPTFKEWAPDHYTPSLFNKLRGSDGKISRDVFLRFAEICTDCFLTHDWVRKLDLQTLL